MYTGVEIPVTTPFLIWFIALFAGVFVLWIPWLKLAFLQLETIKLVRQKYPELYRTLVRGNTRVDVRAEIFDERAGRTRPYEITSWELVEDSVYYLECVRDFYGENRILYHTDCRLKKILLNNPSNIRTLFDPAPGFEGEYSYKRIGPYYPERNSLIVFEDESPQGNTFVYQEISLRDFSITSIPKKTADQIGRESNEAYWASGRGKCVEATYNAFKNEDGSWPGEIDVIDCFAPSELSEL